MTGDYFTMTDERADEIAACEPDLTRDIVLDIHQDELDAEE